MGAPGVVTASIWDTVTAQGAVTTGRSAIIQFVGTSFAGPTVTSGDYGEVMQTAYAISAPGDSGAPVHNQHGDLVGHVVAGYPAVYSIVQDATYQLEAFKSTLR